ncbi:MAG: radical SAM protein [DPANN group archaeon]|nr:radical SAM protein [DPANN group archaeon]
MGVPEKIHVFATDDCNLHCAYCFREKYSGAGDEKNLLKIAEILAESGVKTVVVGGGEPMLVKNLEDVFKILKKEDIFVELHTNCTLLNYKKLEGLQGLVDRIGIPIDTLDEKVQYQLRNYPGYVKLVKNVAKDAQKLGFEIVFHTVAFDPTEQKIPQLYQNFIRHQDFDCWKIYEYNEKMTMQSDENSPWFKTNQDVLDFMCEYELRTGGTDSNVAEFLLLEEKMRKYEDKKVKLVGVLYADYYFFINSKGDAKYYTWFAPRRITVGNVLKDGFSAVIKNYKKVEKDFHDGGKPEEFFGTLQCMPLFARLWEGNYAQEELDEVDGRYWQKIEHLSDLWAKHVLGK